MTKACALKDKSTKQYEQMALVLYDLKTYSVSTKLSIKIPSLLECPLKNTTVLVPFRLIQKLLAINYML